MQGGNHKASFTSTNSSSFISEPGFLTPSKAFVLLGRMLWKDRVHAIVDGDSLEWLAEKYGTTVAALRKLNNLQGDVIYSGSVLKIGHSRDGRGVKAFLVEKASLYERNAMADGILMDSPVALNVAKTANSSLKLVSGSCKPRKQKSSSRLVTVKVHYGDTLADIAIRHGITIRELQKLNNLRDDAIYENDMLAVSHDVDLRSGKRRTTRLLFSRNSPSCQNDPAVGGLSLFSKSSLSTGTSKPEGRWKRRKKGFQRMQDKWFRFCSPLRDGFISSPFGWRWGAFHEGIDLAADQGTAILAADKGVVTFTGWNGGYGYLVAIQHEGGFVTRYAHCCAIHTHVGQQVSKGQQVAAVGTTGRSTGPHLHFEVRQNGEPLDPVKLVNL
ncbi:hypothetical protein O6H91_07G050800 [Diphasiastrum complanatum]|uniref:Uncharacterized protein n=2 Tax=Diphasiastrum complanatum TaxID=34168 RepID=A0ACC2D5H4_DIPCM|nr:hypothetical protein O6H91_Y236900 [Diphasiastrum complanatum]KAJ7299400.1 hypothetical protein O6H91_Y236900 [Diphasiastrum complanatum]KAJ7549369.1 hypothetical protein O6H91_07G050800 [Diphasiastrum complanatum]